MGRAPCCSKVGLHRGPWTPREDALLTKYIQSHGEGQWRSLPKRAGLLRCGKSCRLRWMNYLRPDIKRGNITSEEDDLIIRMHSLLGNRWSLIAGRLPGRTDNEIKNYWNTHLSKKLRNQGMDPITHEKLSMKDPAQPSNKKKNTSRGKKNTNNKSNKQKKKSDPEIQDIDKETKEKTKVYLPKPTRVAAVSLSSSLSIPRTDSTTALTVESNDSGNSSTRIQQQQEEEGGGGKQLLVNNLDWGAAAANEGENDGFGLFGDDENHHYDLVNGSDDMECQSCSDFLTDHGTLEKLYEEYFQLLNMEAVDVQQENQQHMDSFAESLLL